MRVRCSLIATRSYRDGGSLEATEFAMRRRRGIVLEPQRDDWRSSMMMSRRVCPLRGGDCLVLSSAGDLSHRLTGYMSNAWCTAAWPSSSLMFFFFCWASLCSRSRAQSRVPGSCDGSTLSQAVPIYARRFTLRVCEDEEGYFFVPNEEALDHRRRDWTSRTRGFGVPINRYRPPAPVASPCAGLARGGGELGVTRPSSAPSHGQLLTASTPILCLPSVC